MKSVRENEANRFCFMLTLWPPSKINNSESGIEPLKSMVPASMEGMKNTSLRVMSNAKVFAGQPDQHD